MQEDLGHGVLLSYYPVFYCHKNPHSLPEREIWTNLNTSCNNATAILAFQVPTDPCFFWIEKRSKDQYGWISAGVALFIFCIKITRVVWHIWQIKHFGFTVFYISPSYITPISGQFFFIIHEEGMLRAWGNGFHPRKLAICLFVFSGPIKGISSSCIWAYCDT